MPRTRSLAWAELKIGLVAIFALVMAGLLIFLLSGEGGFFWQRFGVKTVFANVAGLKSGAPVRLAGMEVGSVKEVQFLGDRVEVLMEVSKKMQPRITSSSVASLGSVSLLGESAVDITASSQGTPVPEWGYVRSGAAAGSLTDVAEKATAGIEQLSGLIVDLRAGKGTMGRLFTEGALNQLAQGAAAYGEGEIYRLRGDLPAALAPVQRALTLAEPEGYVRIFADEGRPMASLLRAVAKTGIAPGYIRRLLTVTSPTEDERPAAQGLIEPLSAREIDVLRLLGTDLDGPDIARQLVVSLNTVRTHTKNIYAKLGVNNTVGLVKFALRNKLID